MVLDSYACELCNTGQEETLEHLFFQCPFAVSCWNLLHLQVPLQATVLEIMDSLAAQLRTPIFMNILILLCWTIWCTRNGVIFDNQSASLPSCKVFFQERDHTAFASCETQTSSSFRRMDKLHWLIFLLGLIFFVPFFCLLRQNFL